MRKIRGFRPRSTRPGRPQSASLLPAESPPRRDLTSAGPQRIRAIVNRPNLPRAAGQAAARALRRGSRRQDLPGPRRHTRPVRAQPMLRAQQPALAGAPILQKMATQSKTKFTPAMVPATEPGRMGSTRMEAPPAQPTASRQRGPRSLPLRRGASAMAMAAERRPQASRVQTHAAPVPPATAAHFVKKRGPMRAQLAVAANRR